MTRKITITKQQPAAPDHIHTRMYKVDEEYEVGSPEMPEHLAQTFLDEGWAKEGGTSKQERNRQDSPGGLEKK